MIYSNPAFPTQSEKNEYGHEFQYAGTGMTLFQYTAIKVLQGLVANPYVAERYGWKGVEDDAISITDRMMKRLEGRP